MSFISDIIDRLLEIQEFFDEAYDVVWDWVWPFYYLAYPLYYIANAFGWLAHYFGHFREWLYEAQDEIENILSWSNIRSLIRSWLTGIEDLIAWFSNWWYWVSRKVEDWWKAVQVTVKGWIAAAVQGFDDLIEAWDTFWNVTWPSWVETILDLKSVWDNFWATIFPTLVSFTWLETWWNSRLKDVDTLVNTKLVEWLPFYDELVILWEEIKEFFVSPLDWLETKFTDWFLGPEV